MVVILFLLAVVVAAAFCAREAQRNGSLTILAFLLQLAGGLAFGFGLVASFFDGYVEDYGSPPAELTAYAVAGFAAAALTTGAAWFVALRRR